MNAKKRRVCFVITSPIHYSRNFLVLDALENNPGVELHIILGGAVLSGKYASHNFDVRHLLECDGHKNIHEAFFSMDGDGHVAKAKTVGLGVIEFSSILNYIKPDIVVVRGDRFEVLSSVIAAVNMNIPVAHIEGGDVSGTIDESIRHAITKLSHIHFATNEPAYQRILKMGERSEYVFNFGSPDIEVAHMMEKDSQLLETIDFDRFGSGSCFQPDERYLMVMYHPVVTEFDGLAENTRNLLGAIHELGIQAIWFWPNVDAGSEKIAHEMRIFKDTVPDHKIKFLRYLPPKQFLPLLVKASCLVGNSSSGIKECSYLGIPVVDIGSRQSGRLHADNVLNCDTSTEEILKAIKNQLKVGRYRPSSSYEFRDTSRRIADVIATSTLYIQKNFVD